MYWIYWVWNRYRAYKVLMRYLYPNTTRVEDTDTERFIQAQQDFAAWVQTVVCERTICKRSFLLHNEKAWRCCFLPIERLWKTAWVYLAAVSGAATELSVASGSPRCSLLLIQFLFLLKDCLHSGNVHWLLQHVLGSEFQSDTRGLCDVASPSVLCCIWWIQTLFHGKYYYYSLWVIIMGEYYCYSLWVE